MPAGLKFRVHTDPVPNGLVCISEELCSESVSLTTQLVRFIFDVHSNLHLKLQPANTVLRLHHHLTKVKDCMEIAVCRCMTSKRYILLNAYSK